MFGGEGVAKADYGNLFRNSHALIEQCSGGAYGDEVIGGENGGGTRAFINQLQRGGFAFLDGGTGMEDEFFVHFNLLLDKSPPIALKAFLCPRRKRGAGKARDAAMAQFE